MSLSELLVIAIGVSMDAFAVAICKGLSVQKISLRQVFSTALWFGGFQALMPLVGYYLGISFADFVSNIDHWIAFILLGIIGGNMIKESCQKDDDNHFDPDFSVKTMLALAVATSIDALAAGKVAADGKTLHMKNVGGLVSFEIADPDITSVTLFGNAGEVLAGVVTAAFDKDGIPVVRSVEGSNMIRMVPAKGSVFEAGTYYFYSNR